MNRIVTFVKEKSDQNFPAVIQTFSAAAMTLYYNLLVKKFGHIPVPLIIGGPGTGKTTMAKLAMSLIGVRDSLHGEIFNKFY